MDRLAVRSLWTIAGDPDAVLEALLRPERWCGCPAQRRWSGDADGLDGVVDVTVPVGRRPAARALQVEVRTLEVSRPWRVTWHLTGDVRGNAVWELDAIADVIDVRLDLDAVLRAPTPLVGRRRADAAIVRAVHAAGEGLAVEAGGCLQRSVTMAPGGHRRHAVARPGSVVSS